MSHEAHGELVPVGGGDSIPLIRDVLTIGRRESCDICLRFQNVSGIHAQLAFRDGYWYIRDMGSTNGVKVRGARVQEKLLHPDDEITIAKRRYKIEYELAAGRQALEQMLEDSDAEDIMSRSLLERAGLERSRHEEDDEDRPRNFDPGDFLLDDDK